MDVTTWVPAPGVRSHVRRLIGATGLPWRVLAVAAGVPPRVVHALLFRPAGSGLRRIRSLDADALLRLSATTLEAMEHTAVDSGEVTWRLHVLRNAGWSDARIGAWLGTSPHWVTPLLGGELVATKLLAVRAAAACSALGHDGWLAGETWQVDTDAARHAHSSLRDRPDTGGGPAAPNPSGTRTPSVSDCAA